MITLTERGKQIRRDSLTLGLPNGLYHWGGSFSVVEILIALYDHLVTDQDRVIMSKGHCWIPQVVILRERGLDPGFGPRLDNGESCLVGHPFRDPANGIWASTGSLGHGLPVGVGMAFAKKLKKEAGRVYVIVGDGEIAEGTTHESLLLANKFKLDNLTVIVDRNGIQGSGRVDDILPLPDLVRLAGLYRWCAYSIDGHDIKKLVTIIKESLSSVWPNLIEARTVKGAGVSFMENQPAWHARYPTPDELAEALKQLAATTMEFV